MASAQRRSAYDLLGSPRSCSRPLFVAPSGPIVPLIAIGVAVAVVAGATREQLFGGLAALAVGALLFAGRQAAADR